jgi:hypothetical protein
VAVSKIMNAVLLHEVAMTQIALVYRRHTGSYNYVKPLENLKAIFHSFEEINLKLN